MGELTAMPLRSVAVRAADLRERWGVDETDLWVATAQPGARVVYGMGLDAQGAAAPGVAARMRALCEAGLVRLHLVRVRDDGRYPIDFLAVRTGRAVPKGFPRLPRTAADERAAYNARRRELYAGAAA